MRGLQVGKRISRVDEFEQSKVPQQKLKSASNFLGIMTSEHIAGTEFVIGPLFVLHGASTIDVFLGLLFGNLLASLSWALICAPAATKTRHTVFYQLEKISGLGLVSIYNLIIGLSFCITTALMLMVSASALGLIFNVESPGIQDLYPSSPLWVLLVIGISFIIIYIAAFGFDRIARFAKIFAPWIPMIIIGSAIATLPSLGVSKLSDFWSVANEKIWTGVPIEGYSKYTFWHILFFAWLCNSTMHLGLSDMTIFRYAKRSSYGFLSAFAMYTGHLMAWIASGILCANVIMNGIYNPSAAEIAYLGAGITGAICVAIAGGTTAIPSMYRAGMAFHAFLPMFRRWKVTFIIGAVTTIIACFPIFVTKLDQVLGIIALIAAPVGAIVIADLYLFPKLKLKQELAQKETLYINPAVMGAWFSGVACGYMIYYYMHLDFYFFVTLPAWTMTLATYLLFSWLQQKKLVFKAKMTISFRNYEIEE